MTGLASVRLLVLDFDGVLTDNHVYVDQDGRESVRCYRGDGIGINRLRKLGVETVVISSELNPVVKARCDKLRISCAQTANKLGALQTYMKWPEPIGPHRVAYVGNDVNDLECLLAVGHPYVVNDCEPTLGIALMERRGRERYLKRRGGDGAVREVCDLIADAIEEARRNTGVRITVDSNGGA